MNMYGKPVQVTRKLVGVSKNVVSVVSNNWYEPTTVRSDVKVLTAATAAGGLDWRTVGELDNTYVALPNVPTWDAFPSFDLSFQDLQLTPSYELGFIFGCFVRLGIVQEFPRTTLLSSTCKEFVRQRLYEYSHHALGCVPTCQESGDMEYEDSAIWDVFNSFKQCESMVRCNHTKFIEGIHDGILFSGMSSSAPRLESDAAYELLYWATITLGRAHNFSQVVANNYISSSARVHEMDLDMPVTTLEVDCESKSYVMNNFVWCV